MKLTIRQYLDLHAIARRNDYEKVKEYGDAGCDLSIEGNSLLKVAIAHNHIETVEELIKYVDPNIGAEYWNRSPLVCAIRKGLPDVVELLLEKGADYHQVTDEVWQDYFKQGGGLFEKELNILLNNAKIKIQ